MIFDPYRRAAPHLGHDRAALEELPLRLNRAGRVPAQQLVPTVRRLNSSLRSPVLLSLADPAPTATNLISPRLASVRARGFGLRDDWQEGHSERASLSSGREDEP